MPGLFDDLIPPQPAAASAGLFDDLIPPAPAPATEPPSLFETAFAGAPVNPYNQGALDTANELRVSPETFAELPEMLKADAASVMAGTTRRGIQLARDLTPEGLSMLFGITNPEIGRAVESVDSDAALMSQAALSDQQAFAGARPRTFAEDAIQTAARSAPLSAAALATGMATRSPTAATAVLAPLTSGQKFGELTAQDMTPERAAAYADFQGGVESLTEMMPFARLLDATPFGKKLLATIVAEVPGEMTAQLMQGAADYVAEQEMKGVAYTPDMLLPALSKAAEALPQTIASTLIGVGAQTAAARAPQALGERIYEMRAEAAQNEALAERARQQATQAFEPPQPPVAPPIPMPAVSAQMAPQGNLFADLIPNTVTYEPPAGTLPAATPESPAPAPAAEPVVAPPAAAQPVAPVPSTRGESQQALPTESAAGAPVSGTPEANPPAPAATQPQESGPPTAGAAPEASPAAVPTQNAQRVQGARGTQVDTEYEVVDMGTLQRAGGDLQPRNRATDGSYEAQIARNSGEAFNPEFMGKSPEASTGAPIVGEDNVIESGNGRFQILDRVYTQNPAGAAAYRGMLERLGFKTEGMQRPMLIRRRRSPMTPEQRASWVNEANESTMASLSADERARMDAREITPDLLARYNPEAELHSAQNRPFVAEFARRAGADPRAFFSADGRMTQDGITRMQRAMLSAAFGGTQAADKIVADIVSNTDPEVGTQLADLMVRTAPQFAELKSRAAEGRANPAAATLGERVAEAVSWINQQRRSGENPVAMLSQGDLLSGGVDPVVADTVKWLLKPDGKSVQTKKFLTDFVRFLHEEMRATSAPAPQEAINVAGQRAQGTFVPATQGGLFDRAARPARGDGEGRAEGRAQERRSDDGQGSERATEGDNGLPGVVEDARRKKVRKSKKKPGPFASKREGLIGTSTREDAWTDSGIDPDTARLWPIERQFRELTRILRDKFGFGEIKRENVLNVIEAVDVLKDAYVSVRNMLAVLGLNPNLASLGGTLDMSLFRKAGGARAFFQPSMNGGTIGMVRKNDSFAHEWGHALDWHLLINKAIEFKAMVGSFGATGMTRKFGAKNPADPVASAFVDLLNAMFYDEARLDLYRNDLDSKLRAARTPSQKARIQKMIDNLDAGNARPKGADSKYYAEAKAGDGGTSEDGGYLQKPTEMLARAFEAYIASKVEQAGAFDTNFITARDYMYRGEAFDGFAGVYPEAADRVAIFEAFDNLLAAMHREQTLGADMSTDAPTVETAPPRYWEEALPGVKRGWWERAKARANGIRHSEAAARNAAEERAEIREAVSRAIAGPNAGRAAQILARLRMASQNARSAWAIQTATYLNLMGERYPGSANVRQLRAWFATNVGQPFEGLNQGKFKERWKPESRRLQTRLTKIVDAFRVNEWDEQKLRNLRDVLVGVAQPSSPEVTRAAARLRELYDDLYNYGQKFGLQFGYTKNGYLTRIADQTEVVRRPEEFLKKASELYEIVFDRDWPLDAATDPASDVHRSLMSFARQYMNPAIEPVYARVREIKKDISRLEASVKRAQAKGEDTDQIEAKIQEKFEQLAEAIGELHDLVKPVWARDAAHDWYNAILGINRAHHEWEARSPSGSFQKSRTLPEEADALMGDFYITDPIHLTSTYISQIVRRSAFADFFGAATGSKPIGWKLDEALAGLVEDGVLDEDREEISRSIDLMVGRNRTVLTNRGLRWASNLNTWFTPVFLTASVIPSIPEIVSVARGTGRVRDVFRAVGMQMRELAVSLTQYMPEGAQERVRWARAFSELLGVTSSSLTDEIVAARVNLLYQTPVQQQRMARAMHDNLLHPLTMSQRRAVAMIATEALGRAVTEFREGNAKRGADFLAEFGISTKDRQLQDLILSLKDAPSMQDIETNPAFLRLQSAINRFVDQAIQDPGVEDKPRLASQPEFSYMYGLLSYLSSFQRNIVEPTGAILRRSWNDKNAELLHRAMTPIILIGATQLAARMLSYLVTGRGDADDLEKYLESEGPFGMPNWFFMLLSSSGAFGIYDPLLQAVASTKYNKPMSNIMLGPAPGAAAATIEAMIALTGDRNSPNTTTAEYRAVQRAWDYVMAPAILNVWLRNPYTALLPQPVPWIAGEWLTKSGLGPLDGPRQLVPEAMGLEKPQPRKE